MKVSIIPPFSELSWLTAGGNDYHLALAAQALESDEYAQVYRLLSEAGHYIFLDNSAHELGTGLNVGTLLLAADRVGASEIILPDRLFFGDDTLEMSTEARRDIRRYNRQIRLMGVPQGRTLREWTNTLHGLLGLSVDCIGISKDYEVWPGGLQALIRLVRQWSQDVDIHLLGWGRDPEQLYYIARDSGSHVRGVDSTKPFVYALNEIALPMPQWNDSSHSMDCSLPNYPRRKLDYFHGRLSEKAQRLIQQNIDVFRTFGSAPRI